MNAGIFLKSIEGKKSSKLFNVRGEGKGKRADLDGYGKKREAYRYEYAEHMARLDDIVSDKEIRPGDEIEILVARGNEEAWEYAGVFIEIDNGRLRVRPGANGQVSSPPLASIMNIRKAKKS